MNNQAIIFLDIDGVLCTRKAAGWLRSGKPITKGLRIRRPARALDGSAVQRLNNLCAEHQAQVVITSTWRIDLDVPSILTSAGFSGAFHTDWRTDIDGPTRTDEIRRWLAAHEYHRFVVIDDKLLGLESLQAHLVQTDNYHGLEPNDLDRAAQVLMCQPLC